LVTDRAVLVLAPGTTIKTHKEEIAAFINQKKPIIFAVNFDGDEFNGDFVFCSNIKRYPLINAEKVIATSNLLLAYDMQNSNNMISLSRLAFFNGEFWDNSALMLFNLLMICGVDSWTVAGFDGLTAKRNFVDDKYEINIDYKAENNRVKNILNSVFASANITFLTPSEYTN